MPLSTKDVVFIEAWEDDAEMIFWNRFGFSPYEEKCGCCGMAYIPHTPYEDLANATADERGCEFTADTVTGDWSEIPARRYDGSLCDYKTLYEYLSDADITVIEENDIIEEDLEHPERSSDDWDY